MPDISMCAAECGVSRQCYRHPESGTVPNDPYQAWSAFEPDGPDGCDEYIPIKWEPRRKPVESIGDSNE